ncbi:MAG: EAL domain-containing protein [Alphaproteobacteria bacterium]|nr:EAL domain-containing protein [Alphaproteobacteria bacterium]
MNKMEQIAQQHNRYRLYIVGTLYLCVCFVTLGFVAGMWGAPLMTVSAFTMLVAGGVWFESHRRRSSIKKVSRSVSVVSDTQDEMISDIQQMRKYVDVTNTAPMAKSSKAKLSSTKVRTEVSNASDSKDSRNKASTSNKPVERKVIVDTPSHYSEAVTEELIHTAIERSSVEVYLQPVVALPQRRIVMMEVFARLRAGNGQTLSANQYMDIAKSRNLQIRLDNLLLKQGLAVIKKDVRRSINRSYMLNIEENTLRDASFMADLLGFLKSNTRLSSRLVFEIKQSSLVSMEKNSLQVLKALAKLGCVISMDQVENPHIDRDFMREIGVGYIKVSGDRLKDFSATDEGISIMKRIKANLAADNVAIIADKIEDEKTLCELLDLEIDYGQGYLFGKPDRESVYDRSRKTA